MVTEPWYPISSVRGGKFPQQRVRYAYEMLKHPGRSLSYFAVAPTLAGCSSRLRQPP